MILAANLFGLLLLVYLVWWTLRAHALQGMNQELQGRHQGPGTGDVPFPPKKNSSPE
jgi:hypothetical protein